MSLTKNIYEKPCFEYPGYIRQILLVNNIEIFINICLDMSNEMGWNFSKNYIDNIGALDSVSEYLKILNAKEIKVDFFFIE